MVLDPNLKDASLNLEFDDASALKEYAAVPQENFDEWYDKLNGMPYKKRLKTLVSKLKEHLSGEDQNAIDEMVKILEKYKNENTDIEFITKKLQEKNKDVNEIAVLQFYILLNSMGLIMVDKK